MSQQLPAAPDKVPQWEFFHERWLPFTEQANVEVEAAYQASNPAITVHIFQSDYQINILQSCQKNLKTGRMRQIRRTMVILEQAWLEHSSQLLSQLDGHRFCTALARMHCTLQWMALAGAADRAGAEHQRMRQQMQRQMDSPAKSTMLLQNELVAEKEFHRRELLEMQTKLEEMSASKANLETQLKVECDLRKAVEDASRDEIARLKESKDRTEQELLELKDAHIDLQEKLCQKKKAALQLQTSLDAEQQLHETKWNHLRLHLLSQLPRLGAVKEGSGVFGFPQDHPKFVALRDLFMNSMAQHRYDIGSDRWCEAPNVRVMRILEIRNSNLQELFETARNLEVFPRNRTGCSTIPHMQAFKCNVEAGAVDLNEYLLFHGCPMHAVDEISKRGLDPQRGGEVNGTMFGLGSYFAQNASKSDLYTTCGNCRSGGKFSDCCHATGERCILVVRVVLGESMPVTTQKISQSRRAPDRSSGDPYDSVTALTKKHGGRVDHMEFVSFAKNLSLVQYQIYYRHRETCQCQNCQHRRLRSQR